MRIIRYQDIDGSVRHAAEQPDGSYLRIEGELFGRFDVTRQEANIRRKLAPAAPSMIWCIGQNYRRHSEEVGMDVPEHPVVFAKGRNAVQALGGLIWIPAEAKSSEIDYEGELVVVIGRECKDVTRDRALDYVAGYTCGNDVSVRDWQLKMGGI